MKTLVHKRFNLIVSVGQLKPCGIFIREIYQNIFFCQIHAFLQDIVENKRIKHEKIYKLVKQRSEKCM